MAREEALITAFVDLADTLVEEFDVIEFLNRLAGHCVSLLDVEAAGILLTNPQGRLHLIAASSEKARLLELMQLQGYQGPCVACYTERRRIDYNDADPKAPVTDLPWSRFAKAARQEGFHSVCALPMRHNGQVIGALNLFRIEPGILDERNAMLGQALADIATIGILQERASRQREVLAQQLQHALDSRVIIEQAKGFLAHRLQVSLDDAFHALRTVARNGNRKLVDVALQVVTTPESVVPRRPVADPAAEES
ncbi:MULTISPECIES: GAF and ANTAR domain-containing protein [unclassified Streptomyces]|uniref:GAF and ANTAR domain-containing protein n=1 Tax=unclassified Streptomyces TaxID=2593676 RepID=UPI001F03F517|nr:MULTISPECIES: GAF and ANTAR domain-containing protein [unclassified Streptomyces]MCH0567029.1 GAF and ANTAR domain-containing protein [Streptomyces sp. MUM 2J]MCH0572396.1 GAF and ANTAR domain-containing protein [Streptomyces sp. MUM 136J]